MQFCGGKIRAVLKWTQDWILRKGERIDNCKNRHDLYRPTKMDNTDEICRFGNRQNRSKMTKTDKIDSVDKIR